MADTTRYARPLGGAATVTLTAADAAQTITVTNDLTMVDGVTNPISVNVTLTADIPAGLQVGAMMFMQATSVGAQTLTFGDGFSPRTVTGVAGKTINGTLIYNGSVFTPLAARVQID